VIENHIRPPLRDRDIVAFEWCQSPRAVHPMTSSLTPRRQDQLCQPRQTLRSRQGQTRHRATHVPHRSARTADDLPRETHREHHVEGYWRRWGK
jgi:hypothetical protein